MKKANKILSIILAILMVIFIIPLTASAATYSGTCGDNLTWTYNSSNGYLAISGTGLMYDYKTNNRPWESYEDNIKMVTVEYSVTSIGDYAFYQCEKLHTITLPDSITEIGEYAFKDCSKLKNIKIPDSVKVIKSHTFTFCENLTEITIPNSITEIGESAFYACYGLTEIVIPDSVTTIYKNAFEYCDNLATVVFGNGLTTIDKFAFAYCTSLESITIPLNVTSIENGAFAGCESLSSIIVDSDNKYFSNDEYGVLFNKDKTILIQYPLDSDVIKYTVPDSVTQIGIYSFDLCGELAELTIPNSVTIIENPAFSYKQTIIIYYEGTAEQWNSMLEKSSELPVHWSDDYYVHCSDKIIFPSGSCGEDATWEFNKITGVLTISGTGDMTDYELSYSGSYGQPWESFSDSVKEVVIEDGITTVGNCAFASFDNLTTMSIANSVTTISKEAFSHCDNLSNIIISDGITTIEEDAFYDCKSITSVVIPLNVTFIDEDAFDNCPNITDVYYEGTEEQWKDNFVPSYDFPSLTSRGPFYPATIHYNYHIHRYDSVVTAPTCTEQGFTTYTCECDYTYTEYIDALGHDYSSEVTTHATHLTTGIETFTCTCGDSYTEIIEKLEKHNYDAVIIAPTCTEQGYTTYTCECGDTYIADYVDELGHTEVIIPAVAPTCTETGLSEGTKCSVCGETITEQEIIPANGHTSANAVEENYVAPTCTENGSKDVVVYCSVCDEEISCETVTLEATGHTDNNGDGYCDADNELLDPSVECDHVCHKNGILGFFWRIINIFNMLFGLNKTCDCGVAHY